MLNDINKAIYSVQLVARVVDRETKEVLVPDLLVCSMETPSLYYYQGHCAQLRAQIIHLARVRYVYQINAQIDSDPAVAKRLAKRDWMIEIEEGKCQVTPDPTDAHRERFLSIVAGPAQMSGFVASAAMRA